MALTATREFRSTCGHLFLGQFLVTFDSSYASGGESLTASILPGVTAIDEVISVMADTPQDGTKSFFWDRTNQKLICTVEDGTSGVNAAATGDQSTAKCRIVVLFH